MVVRLASLVLIMIIAGSVCAGMPLHSHEQECNMLEMTGMDCCKKAAQTDELTPEVSTARLCCALNCSQSGTTGTNETRLPRPSASQALFIPASSAAPVVARFQSLLRNSAESPPPYSSPVYIRHLALLI